MALRLSRPITSNPSILRRDLSAPLYLSNFNWQDGGIDAQFALACVALLVAFCCFAVAFQTRWGDRSIKVGYKVATGMSILNLIIAITNFALNSQGVVLTFGYNIVFIIQTIAAETQDVLIILVLYRCIEECHGFTTQTSGPGLLRRIHNTVLMVFILVAILAISLYINLTSELISNVFNDTYAFYLAWTWCLASSVAYYATYLAITIEALLLTILYCFKSQQSKLRAAFLLVTAFALWVYALVSLVLIASLSDDLNTGSAGEPVASPTEVSNTGLMDDIIPRVAYIAGAVSLIGLAVNGRVRTSNGANGGLNEPEMGTEYAYGRDGPTELPYQPAAGIYEAPAGRVHEAPADAKGARGEMWGDSAQIHKVSGHLRPCNVRIFEQWRGNQQKTPLVEAPAYTDL